MKKLPSLNDIKVIKTEGSWPTKSGGTLNVLYRLDFETVTKFLEYDTDELAKIPIEIRGLRSYIVKDIPNGSIGANEWHRVRNELCYCISGSFRWECTDTYGETREFIIDKDTAILTPHHILHAYTALENNSAISVLANTLFLPHDPATHDTYSASDFLS